MTDHTDPAPRTADTSGSSLPPTQSFDIAPEDQELADRITNFDPVHDVPSPSRRIGGSQKPLGNLKATMVSPEFAKEVAAKLDNVPHHMREKREHELVYAHLYENARQVRIKAGPGEGANAFQRERFLIAGERDQATKELLRLTEQLADVIRWEPERDADGKQVIDPDTGAPKVKAVEALQGEQRRGVEARIAELEHRIALLDGPEGDQRERRALWQAVQAEKAKQAQLDEDREARKLATTMNREERIKAKAEAYAKRGRNQL